MELCAYEEERWNSSVVLERFISKCTPFFKNRRPKEKALLQLVNLFCLDFFGDKVQLLSMSNCYCQSLLNNTQSQLKTSRSTCYIEHIEFTSKDDLEELLNVIKKINDAANACFTTFSDIDSPMLSVSDINELIDSCKTNIPLCCRTMRKTLGIHHELSATRNLHLTQTIHYDRIIFYNFLCQCRLKNLLKCIAWEMIAAASIFSRGPSDSIQKRVACCSVSSSVKKI